MAFKDAFLRRTPGYAGGTLEEQLARDALLQSQEPQVLTPQNQQAITRPRTVGRRGLTAAMLTPEGTVQTGKTHPDILMKMGRPVPRDRSSSEYGFVTDDGKFVSREEAARIAGVPNTVRQGSLYSEDLTAAERGQPKHPPIGRQPPRPAGIPADAHFDATGYGPEGGEWIIPGTPANARALGDTRYDGAPTPPDRSLLSNPAAFKKRFMETYGQGRVDEPATAPQQEGFGSSGEPFGSTRPRRTQPRDVIADDAQYLRDLQVQPRGKKDKIMDVIDAVNAGFGNPRRTTMTKRERQIAETQGRLGTELTVGQKQNAIQQGQMVPVELEDGTVVQVPARSAGGLQSQQQRIRQQAEQVAERKRMNAGRMANWNAMSADRRQRLIADLYKSGGLNDPDLLEYAADQLGVPGTLREKFISGQMRDAVDENGNLIQVNRQNQQVLPVGAKSYETTKEAGRNRRFAEGQAGATTRAGMRGTGERGAGADKTANRRAAVLVGQIERARSEMERADAKGDKTAKENARLIGEQAASELNALGAGYEAGRGEGGYPYYKKGATQAPAAQGGGQYAGRRISKDKVPEFAKRHGMTTEEAMQFLANEKAIVY